MKSWSAFVFGGGDGNIFPSKQFTYIILVAQELSQSVLVNYLMILWVLAKHQCTLFYTRRNYLIIFRWISCRNSETIATNTEYNSSETGLR